MEDLYGRKISRMQMGQFARVPKMKESQDSWTRLNVLPAKVMQVYDEYMKHECMLIIAR